MRSMDEPINNDQDDASAAGNMYRRRTMADFREIIPEEVMQTHYAHHVNLPLETLDFITADPDTPGANNAYKAAKVNYDLVMEPLVRENNQKCAYIFGIIFNLVPAAKEGIAKELVLNGIGVNEIKIPSMAAESFVFVPEEPMDERKAVVVFGLSVIMLFKTVADINFTSFIKKRVCALASIAGYSSPDDASLNVFSNLARAIRYKKLFGQIPGVKSTVLRAIIQNSGSATIFSSVCAYVARILSWHDMSWIIFINQTLLIPKSPVIRAPEVAYELKNLRIAYKTILKSFTPQYYGIFCNPMEYWLLDRSNFPLLAEVAYAIKLKMTPSNTFDQYQVSMRNTNNPTVTKLINLHLRAFNHGNPDNMASNLTNQEDRDD